LENTNYNQVADSVTATTSTWSSSKINSKITELNSNITQEANTRANNDSKLRSDLTTRIDGLSRSLSSDEDEYTALISRMSALEAAGTVDDSEVIGLRTGYNGITYTTAGDMVRDINKQLLNYSVTKSLQDSSGDTILDSSGNPILGQVKYVSYDAYQKLQKQMDSLTTVLVNELKSMHKKLNYISEHALFDSY
jgi:hypothetical protein